MLLLGITIKDVLTRITLLVSIGSLGKNRTTDRVENVRVDTCLLTNTTNGVRIKSWQVTESLKDIPLLQYPPWQEQPESSVQLQPRLLFQGGMGFAHDLRFESIVMKNVSNPIIIDQYYCDQPTPCANQVVFAS
jgi:hypothetical protein